MPHPEGLPAAVHQVEGGSTNADCWDFEQNPATAARESSGDGIAQFHCHREDFALLASLGHNTHTGCRWNGRLSSRCPAGSADPHSTTTGEC